MNTIGDRLKELRGPSSQREMADAVGIRWNAWARYEAGGAMPGAEIIIKICRAHAVSSDWLLGLDDKRFTGKTFNVRAGSGGVAIAGSGNRVTGVAAGAPTTAACAKCPYKKKLKSLEKAFKQNFTT